MGLSKISDVPGKCGAPRAIDDTRSTTAADMPSGERTRATVEQLTIQMNQGATNSVSQTTLQRRLLRLGLRSRCLVHAPMLFISDEGWNLHASTANGCPPSGDRLVRNLAQLAMALESAWLNISVNTFRNLIDFLPARLAAVRPAKGGYSGF
ncbi:hypothetical protein HPB52_003538 [Rhipicephalus sanguineus]|uniref:Transposase Tc1-like domain-containing protein n=1 Tax=Rhipicephalus sanguineus TaxID=34632 RepID=A0A9D4QDD8_RHISA|nr:hypothetical protein HPB52_003538 [Rhipicephalus sanguineus]